MSNNIAWLIQDIDKLDGHRQNMMEELKVLRDITLFYNERHPKLHAAGSKARPKEDNTQGSARQHDTTTPPDEPEQTIGDTDGGTEVTTGETKKQL